MIRGMRIYFSLAMLLLITATAQAQTLKLPRKSPKARTTLTVGLTEIDIQYSSPAVRGRTIWGDLEPYDSLWRAGANEATVMAFSTDIRIEGQRLPKGRYAFFVIPRAEGDWTLIFNAVPDQWGTNTYNREKDVLRIDVKPKFSNVREERLTYKVVDQGIDQGYIRLGWEKLRLYLRFEVEVMKQALANIKEAIENAAEDEKWLVLAQSADFLLYANQELPLALDYASQSVALQERAWNYWIKAQAHAANNDYKNAIASAKKIKTVAMASPADTFYKDMQRVIEQALEKWQSTKD
jgi:hypothetical protein